jgi:hypothetical protein
MKAVLRAGRPATHTPPPVAHTCGSFADIEAKGADPRWRKKMIARRATVKQFESRINRVLMDARRETLANLEGYTPAKAALARGVAADFIFDLVKFTESFFKGMRAVSANAINEAGNDVWKELGKDDVWSAPPQAVVDYVDSRKNLLSNVPQDIFDSIRGELQTGFNEGESKEKIAARVRSKFNEISVGRSRTIAQTETSAAYGFADYNAQKDAGIQWREWLSSGLADTPRS